MKCLICGKEMPNKPSFQKYCSYKCKYEAHKQRVCEAPLEAKQCVICNKIFYTNRSYQKTCSRSCYRKLELKIVAEREARLKAEEMEARATHQHVKTLSDWVKEAAECKLDYGTYRALINQGKTFEELKAQAHFRCLPMPTAEYTRLTKGGKS